MTTQGLEAATEKMRSAGVPGVAIDVFSRFHELLRSQVTGLIPIQPPSFFVDFSGPRP